MKRFAIMSCAFLAVMSLAATASAVPPHKAGEVAVYGAPDTLTDYQVVKHLPWANLTVVKVETGQEWGHIQKLRQKGRVAGYNLIANKCAVPNDPLFQRQWHMSAVQAEQAWDISTGTGVVVAVLDTGLAMNEDGIGCVDLGYNAIIGGSNFIDGNGHGTHVSGTIAQETNNGIGVAGLAYDACIMPVKVLSDSGSGTFADIADGIYYAVDQGAQVINMSLGVTAGAMSSDPIVDPALDYAYASGVTVVVAAGNDGSRRTVGYPAIYPTTIAVGSVGYDNVYAWYSNRGTGLDIMAPGGNMSQDLDGDGFFDGVLQETLKDGEWAYHYFQGTSMAAPHVAAGAALLIASGMATSPDEVYEALTGSALYLGFARDYGHGLMQVYDALNYGVTPVCDADNDGFYNSTCDGDDCDDDNEYVNTGAEEKCGDGIDNNCDGQIDEGCCNDLDNDNDTWSECDGDCNDSNFAINPGATEECGDGIDNDCNGQIDEGCAVIECLPKGEYCSADIPCCSGSCHPRKGTCK